MTTATTRTNEEVRLENDLSELRAIQQAARGTCLSHEVHHLAERKAESIYRRLSVLQANRPLVRRV